MIIKIPITEYKKQKNDILIDLRDKAVYDFGSINDAVNIPMENIEKLQTG